MRRDRFRDGAVHVREGLPVWGALMEIILTVNHFNSAGNRTVSAASSATSILVIVAAT